MYCAADKKVLQQGRACGGRILPCFLASQKPAAEIFDTAI